MKILAMLAAVVALGGTAHAAEGTLTEVTSFGSNPGALKMFQYAPAGLPANAPLVVYMHGCSQTAADGFKAGWAELADELGFYVVYPQQETANNPIRCFNWAGEYGEPANLIRGMGENESIRQMVEKMKATHSIDAGRVFVAGFSAGGAMVPVMLSTWPDVFAAGAVMSGVPYRCATTVNEAYNCQALASHAELKKTPAQWGDLVRAAHGGYAGPYPRVVIFHGATDGIVSIDNQPELIEQWTDVHATDGNADETTTIGAHTRTRFTKGGQVVLESWRLGGTGHAISMGNDPDHPCTPTGGGYIESRDLCAPYRAALFFGLVDGSTEPPLADGGVQPPGPDGGSPPQPGAPAVSITAPGDGDEVDGAITITASASDEDGVARVEFFVDGVLKGSDGSAPYTQLWQTASYAAGAHELRAVAYDAYETSAEHTIQVTVGAGGGGGGNGDELVDPIPCGCSAGHGRGGAAGTLLLIGFAWWIGRRKR